MMLEYYVTCFTVLCALLHTSLACNGYSIRVNYIKMCVPNPVLNLENNNITLDENCIIHSVGCADFTKPFNTLKATYIIKKPPYPAFEGEIDACETFEKMTDPFMINALDTFQIPKKCPVKAEKLCANSKKILDISKFKNQLGMAAGNIDVKVEMEHDVGKSCLDMSFTIAKAKRTG